MPLTLRQKLASKIASGLRRSAVTTCSKWSERYRVMGEPFPGSWSFDHHPWLLEMHDADCETLVGQKAAQLGYTEFAINVAFYFMDIRSLDVLYILPTSSDASTFSSARFDPALSLSPYLKDFFSDVNNVSLKRAATSTLYVRGSHSKSKLKSVPTAIVIFDELDEMPDYTVPLALERQSGQLFTRTIMLSTPTIQGKGINAAFRNSSEEYYNFKCPSCSRFIRLVEANLEIHGETVTDPAIERSRLKCLKCDATLEHKDKVNFLRHRDRGGSAHFVPTHLQRNDRGVHVSQLYSMAKVGQPRNLALSAIKARTDPSYAQEWYNSKLGLPYTAPGAKLTDEQITSCLSSSNRGDINTNCIRTMGVDVGSVLHIVVKEWYQRHPKTPELTLNDCFEPKVVLDKTSSGSMNDFDEAAELFQQLQCRAGIVDGEPERRMAQQFAMKLQGRVLLCDYQYSQRGRSVTHDKEENVLKVNRTSWLDLSLGRFRNRTVTLPFNISQMYKDQIKSPTRVLRTDKYGQSYAIYVNEGPDHFAHADVYAEIALPFAIGLGTSSDIQGMY